jgi:hypothetical protein
MAENLYKEWFVRFRFPGYENAAFEKGFPKWELVKLADLVTVKAGGDRPDICVDEYTEECPVPVYSNGIDNDGLYETKTITTSFVGYYPYNEPKYTFIIISPNISSNKHQNNYKVPINRYIIHDLTKILFENT